VVTATKCSALYQIKFYLIFPSEGSLNESLVRKAFSFEPYDLELPNYLPSVEPNQTRRLSEFDVRDGS
jgi:hypothetical protein